MVRASDCNTAAISASKLLGLGSVVVGPIRRNLERLIDYLGTQTIQQRRIVAWLFTLSVIPARIGPTR